MAKGKGELKPKLVTFQVNQWCCEPSEDGNKSLHVQNALDTQTCKKMIEAIAKYVRKRVTMPGGKREYRVECEMVFTGGEPLEREDIFELVKFAVDLGFKATMTSCGYMVTEDTIAKLKDAGLQGLTFCLDAGSEELNDSIAGRPGAFKAIAEASKAAKKAKLPFDIRTKISKRNADEFVGIAELAKRYGAKTFNPFILKPGDEDEGDAIIDAVDYERIVYELLRMKMSSEVAVKLTCTPQFARICDEKKTKGVAGEIRGCRGGRELCYISSTGEVQVCRSLGISAGNLVENDFDFASIWNDSELLNRVRDVDGYDGPCAECEYRAFCGGCRASAAAHGNLTGPDPLCSKAGH